MKNAFDRNNFGGNKLYFFNNVGTLQKCMLYAIYFFICFCFKL